jgi:hypothetical protein
MITEWLIRSQRQTGRLINDDVGAQDRQRIDRILRDVGP